MNWSFGGWLAAALVVVGAISAVIWMYDRRRLVAESRQIRLRAEAESDRLRLRISVLKPVEAKVVELQTEVAALRPPAARVPELEASIRELREAAAERDSSTLDLEREAATLRARVTDVDHLELEAARSASRTAELERRLAGLTERLIQLERVEAELGATREEVERLSARVDDGANREREASREIGALTGAAALHQESAALAEARATAAETLINRRDEIILVLEQRLAERESPQQVTGNGVEPPPVATGEPPRSSVGEPAMNEASTEADGTGEAMAEQRRKAAKAAKAERKRAKKRAKRMQRAAEKAAKRAAAEQAERAAQAEQPAQVERAPEAEQDDRLPSPGAGAGDRDRDGDGEGDERSELERAAPSTGRPDAQVTSPDDLQTISGIGPVMERTLNEHGIHRLDQLAALDDNGAAALSSRLPGVPGRVERDGWVRQARAMIGQLADDEHRLPLHHER